jgi:hypothetical protein
MVIAHGLAECTYGRDPVNCRGRIAPCTSVSMSTMADCFLLHVVKILTQA